MTEKDISIVSKKIDDEKEYLQFLSQKIWENPEIRYEETLAHALLTEALTKYGFDVQKHYFLPTAFRAEFCNSTDDGPTVAVLCEYDALPEIGHACGHNLIAEAGIAAGMAVKAAMEADSKICGKVVVLGTPAEEGGSGKVKLIEYGAFKDIDASLMVHPTRRGASHATTLCLTKATVTYTGKEAHASAFPWEGKNALDAAVACYTNISLLRQQMKPTYKIHGIITKGGVAPNIIPGETEMEFLVRTPTSTELTSFKKRVVACFESAALATDCDVVVKFHDTNLNIVVNKVLADTFLEYAESFGLEFPPLAGHLSGGGSTDMGDVSHITPSMHPFYGIGGDYANHSKNFTAQAITEKAQTATLAAAKAMALVVLKLMKEPELFQEMKDQFHKDTSKERI